MGGDTEWRWERENGAGDMYIYISRSEVITSVGTISSGTAYLLLDVCCWTLGHSERDHGNELVQ